MSDTKRSTDGLSAVSLPRWEELPDLDLYMDQVLSLMNRYLGGLPAYDEKGITSSMINNYVKLGIMPAPQKKRYTRIHLAYLIMIYILKSSLSMAQIQALLEKELSVKSPEELYESFRGSFRETVSDVTDLYSKTDDEDLSASCTAAIRAYVEQSVAVSLLEE